MRRLLALTFLCCTAAHAQVTGPLVTAPAAMGHSETLANIAQMGQATAFVARVPRVARSHYIGGKVIDKTASQALLAAPTTNVVVAAPAPYIQTATYQPLGAVMGANFEALGVGTPGFAISGAPPDTTLGVSPTQIVQWVNTQIGVYDKAGNPLLPAPGFINGNQIWQGLPDGSLCKTFNRGDPLVQYDRYAQRWILSQFAFTGTFNNNAQCIAVSTTSNALGSYTLYEYNFGTELPDYGKLGIWPDAYYLTYNMFNNGANYSGGRACAYDRAMMIAGQPATQICFNSTSRFSFLPSDMEGPNLPPAGAPNYHLSWNWYFVAAAPYTMQLTKFVPDFGTPANSTFSDGFGGATFSFVGFLLDAGTLGPCGDAGFTGFQCVRQLGTAQTLDTLGDRHMYRLAYRNFGTYDALVVTQTVDVAPGGANNAYMRWWEIRNPGANPPTIFQNSNYRPDGAGVSRWMASMATDKLGNIAIGYSVSSSTMNPAIRVSGRRKTDPKNLMRTEATIIAGAGSQTGGLERWGDYSTMQIDPLNDCTFWYTNQYQSASGSFNWNTRIAAFRFPNCS